MARVVIRLARKRIAAVSNDRRRPENAYATGILRETCARSC